MAVPRTIVSFRMRFSMNCETSSTEAVILRQMAEHIVRYRDKGFKLMHCQVRFLQCDYRDVIEDKFHIVVHWLAYKKPRFIKR